MKLQFKVQNHSPLPLEGVSQLCFDFVAVHMDASRWNSTNQFRRLKGVLKNPLLRDWTS